MKLYSFASSSSGNCYLYVFETCNILVDLGISNKRLKEKLKEINLEISDIDQVLITHEHGDHIKGLEVFQKNNKDVTINMTKGTYEALKYEIDNINIIKNNNIVKIDSVEVIPLTISHDANEPVGFIFSINNEKYGHLTDTGYINDKLKSNFKNLTFYLLESNYEERVLITNNKYPFSVKKRINSDLGHLSNKQTNQYIRELIGDKTKIVCLGHLSENNNDSELVEIINNNIGEIKLNIMKKDETVEVECK